jgi:hypothetical protein
MASQKSTMKQLLLYRVVPHNGGVVFAAEDRAKSIARIHRAIETSTTWSQFRAAIPPGEYSAVMRSSFDAIDETRPKASDPFDPEQIAGWSDGDYPPWLQQEMDDVVPEPLLLQFATREQTAVNGAFWLIPEEQLERICAALRAAGLRVRRAQGLPFQ